MRSRTSLFDRTVLKKNIIRFAPAWGLYSLGLLMFLVSQAEVVDLPPYFASAIAYSVPNAMGAVNFFYALISAQLVFGDLYNTRMCNALTPCRCAGKPGSLPMSCRGCCFPWFPIWE